MQGTDGQGKGEARAPNHVTVAVRVRPLVPRELLEGAAECLLLDVDNASISMPAHGSQRHFAFDHVLDAGSDQVQLYETCVARCLDAWLDGYNASILAYGQTGSGKTRTLDEIIPLLTRDLFQAIKQRQAQGTYCQVLLGYLELYNEDLRDLLATLQGSQPPAGPASVLRSAHLPPANMLGAAPLAVHPGTPAAEKSAVPGPELSIRETPSGEIFVEGAREPVVKDADHLLSLVHQGNAARTVSATALNATSSRSHTVLTLTLEQQLPPDPITGEVELLCSKLHLVDLAGSERPKRSGVTGLQLKEAVNINQGLLALGNVVNALGEEARKGVLGQTHIPYRDSKLTRLLQDSLGGSSITTLIACVSPALESLDETVSTLKYAQRARCVQNMPLLNRTVQGGGGMVSAEQRALALLKHAVGQLAEGSQEQDRGREAAGRLLHQLLEAPLLGPEASLMALGQLSQAIWQPGPTPLRVTSSDEEHCAVIDGTTHTRTPVPARGGFGSPAVPNQRCTANMDADSQPAVTNCPGPSSHPVNGFVAGAPIHSPASPGAHEADQLQPLQHPQHPGHPRQPESLRTPRAACAETPQTADAATSAAFSDSDDADHLRQRVEELESLLEACTAELASSRAQQTAEPVSSSIHGVPSVSVLLKEASEAKVVQVQTTEQVAEASAEGLRDEPEGWGQGIPHSGREGPMWTAQGTGWVRDQKCSGNSMEETYSLQTARGHAVVAAVHIEAMEAAAYCFEQAARGQMGHKILGGSRERQNLTPGMSPAAASGQSQRRKRYVSSIDSACSETSEQQVSMEDATEHSPGTCTEKDASAGAGPQALPRAQRSVSPCRLASHALILGEASLADGLGAAWLEDKGSHLDQVQDRVRDLEATEPAEPRQQKDGRQEDEGCAPWLAEPCRARQLGEVPCLLRSTFSIQPFAAVTLPLGLALCYPHKTAMPTRQQLQFEALSAAGKRDARASTALLHPSVPRPATLRSSSTTSTPSTKHNQRQLPASPPPFRPSGRIASTSPGSRTSPGVKGPAVARAQVASVVVLPSKGSRMGSGWSPGRSGSSVAARAGARSEESRGSIGLSQAGPIKGLGSATAAQGRSLPARASMGAQVLPSSGEQLLPRPGGGRALSPCTRSQRSGGGVAGSARVPWQPKGPGISGARHHSQSSSSASAHVHHLPVPGTHARASVDVGHIHSRPRQRSGVAGAEVSPSKGSQSAEMRSLASSPLMQPAHRQWLEGIVDAAQQQRQAETALAAAERRRTAVALQIQRLQEERAQVAEVLRASVARTKGQMERLLQEQAALTQQVAAWERQRLLQSECGSDGEWRLWEGWGQGPLGHLLQQAEEVEAEAEGEELKRRLAVVEQEMEQLCETCGGSPSSSVAMLGAAEADRKGYASAWQRIVKGPEGERLEHLDKLVAQLLREQDELEAAQQQCKVTIYSAAAIGQQLKRQVPSLPARAMCSALLHVVDALAVREGSL